ncbi:heme-containing dehydratase protein [Dactylonectria estremocensis]|uniref:Heme-containing dehydratase protein n=1 Tax=Dactylonectria estremocensis TaxID=1079267 RepID=A0A9P9JFA2_9HYPO|nr:heme-containing dehydratase protein [Dactylonectria estremocensis]
MPSPERKYPLRKPENHVPPIPRYQLVLGTEKDSVHTAYIGIQQHARSEDATDARTEAIRAIESWLHYQHPEGPQASESFTLLDGHDARNTVVWVCYWRDEENYKKSLTRLNLSSVYASLSVAGRGSIGIWQESFSTITSRLETNYSGLDYLPGLARLPETSVAEHSLSAYWGAARDRIPDSAHDLFDGTDADGPKSVPAGLGQHLVGTNYHNLVHIRSGQFWENCDAVESAAYEEKLEPTLRDGLQFLWDNPAEGGAVGLRYLQNTEAAQDDRKESCVTGFFTSLGRLESWAKTHKSHLAIFRGALAHAKLFGDARKFRTWHEVSVLNEGEARFEYVNCVPETGVIPFIPLVDQSEAR